MKETETKLLRHFYETTLAGGYPDVPLVNGVDIQALVAGDPDPMFLTLQIAEDGRVATDGMRYTPAFNEQVINETIQARRVLANMGHMTPFEMDYKFDVPAAIWLGAMRDEGGIWWGKAYIVDANVKNFLKAMKAANGTVATSIAIRYSPLGTNFLDDGTFTIEPDAAELLNLDIAPEERAGLKMDRTMALTRHMANGEKIMNRDEVIADLTVDDIDKLPAGIKEAILSTAPPVEAVVTDDHETKITHMQTENDKLRSDMIAMQATLDASKAQVFELSLLQHIIEAVPTDTEAGMLRDYVQVKTLAHLKGEFDDFEAAKAFVDELVASKDFQTMARSVISHVAGGPAIIAVRRSKAGTDDIDIDAIEARYGIH